MRCVVDLQAAQNLNRFGEIGRYCFNLALAMAHTAGEHELWLALNASFGDQVERIRAAFDGVVPQDRIVLYRVPTPCAEIEPGNHWRARAAEMVRENFLESLNPDMLYVMNVFEGLRDDSVSSIGSFARNLPTAGLVYDFVPSVRPPEHLSNATVKAWYARKLQSLQSVELLTTVSESSRQEAITHAHTSADRVVNIGCGIDPRFRPVPPGESRSPDLRQRYGIGGGFVMYSGGVDPHNNVDGLIRAFALLPSSLRKSHQLLMVGADAASDREFLLRRAQANDLRRNSIIFTGDIPDDDLIGLYRECSVFVLPSFHECFGLSAAEAMACGAPTIGSDNTGILEVVGRQDALFDPHEPAAISRKIQQALTDEEFKQDLRRDGLLRSQQFDWQSCARRAWSALEQAHERRSEKHAHRIEGTDIRDNRRPRLAYFSPLPPVPSGISDYSADLLPELARYYDIDVVAFQLEVTEDRVTSNCAVRSLSFFEANASRYSRIVYHMGNSPFHAHMWRLMERYPGTVVLHDFYHSHLVKWVEDGAGVPFAFGRALYAAHGYGALLRERSEGREAAIWDFPCNRHVLDAAAGVIVHSAYSIALAGEWYGRAAASDWVVIPMLRGLQNQNRARARARFGFADSDYVVCSFGMVVETKLTHRLIAAWSRSTLARDPNCKLVFVGEMHQGTYGRQLKQEVESKRLTRQVQFIGLTDTEKYNDYLAAADTAVQLRTQSRGETSKAVFDCLANGVPTVVNAHGSLCDLEADAVLTLADEFTDEELATSLESLHDNPELRRQLSQNGQMLIRSSHDPARVAEQYSRAIEHFATTHPRAREEGLLRELGAIESNAHPSEVDLIKTVSAVAENRKFCGQRQLLLDVSATAKYDLKTGIERVARAIVMESIQEPPAGLRVEPVEGADGKYRYARSFTLRMIGSGVDLPDSPVEVHTGDIYLALDWSPEAICSSREFFVALRARGIKICFVVYDLLPLRLPHRFPGGIDKTYRAWLETIVEVADKVITISRAVADDLLAWLDDNRPLRMRQLEVCYWRLGADVQASAPSRGLPAEADVVLESMQERPSFLMVGTIEPRKGHAQVLSAIEQLWKAGIDVSLVIVGKQGWMMEALAERIKQHREYRRRLFWLVGISDEMLLRTYEHATALIAASEGEGFGLPLIEAARAGVPLITRDLPVFREVAGERAFYFSGDTPEALSSALRRWLELFAEDAAPEPEGLPWIGWKESTRNLMEIVMGDACYRLWPMSLTHAREVRRGATVTPVGDEPADCTDELSTPTFRAPA